MGISDVFKTKQFKTDIERLTAENDYLNALLTPELSGNRTHQPLSNSDSRRKPIFCHSIIVHISPSRN